MMDFGFRPCWLAQICLINSGYWFKGVFRWRVESKFFKNRDAGAERRKIRAARKSGEAQASSKLYSKQRTITAESEEVALERNPVAPARSLKLWHPKVPTIFFATCILSADLAMSACLSPSRCWPTDRVHGRGVCLFLRFLLDVLVARTISQELLGVRWCSNERGEGLKSSSLLSLSHAL
jgi:hypothetical protein